MEPNNVAQAVEPIVLPSTGIEWLDMGLAIIVAVGFVLFVTAGALANVLPKHWPLTKKLAQLATDLRGLTRPKSNEEIAIEDAVKSQKKGATT